MVALPMTLLMGTFMPLRTTTPLPGAWETVYTYIFCLSCEEIGFFYLHRLIHQPRFYKHLHKLHHGKPGGYPHPLFTHSRVVTGRIHSTRRPVVHILHSNGACSRQHIPDRARNDDTAVSLELDDHVLLWTRDGDPQYAFRIQPAV